MRINILALSLFFSIYCHSQTISDQDSVKKVIDEYCNVDFLGNKDNDRYNLVKFSPKMIKKLEKRGPEDPSVIFWNWEKYTVVSSFKISTIETKQNKAKGLILFKRIAKCLDKSELIEDYKENDTTIINLVKDNNKWWIFDPPQPHISAKSLLEFYSFEIETFSTNMNLKSNRDYVLLCKKNVALLNKLQNESTLK